MSNYLKPFSAAREVVLPCLFLPSGTRLPANVNERKNATEQEASRLSRKMLRVTPHILPSVERAVSKACLNLRISRTKVHAFVSPNFGEVQAVCWTVFDEPVVVFSSQIVELMNEDELCFVAGHEIGHFLLPEAHFLKEDTCEGRIHSRAAELSMDRIGTIACGDPKAACNASMKLMSGLKEPHLRTDVSAFLAEARNSFDGTFQSHEDASHPPGQLRLWAIVQFSLTDAFLRPSGKSGGSPVDQINNAIAQRMHEQIDRHVIASFTEHTLMSKSWLYCLCRGHGSVIDLKTLNQFGTAVDTERLNRAWASLSGFTPAQIIEHAQMRLLKSLEQLQPKSPRTVKQLLELTAAEPSMKAIRHLIPLS